MTLDEIIRLARVRATFDFGPTHTSSWLCFEHALLSRDRGDLESAKYWAVRSLKHSLGIFHRDYQQAIRGEV